MAILGKLRFNYKGEWDTSESYSVDDIVKYDNGYFVCVQDADSGDPNPSDDVATDLKVGDEGFYWRVYTSSFDANAGEKGYQSTESYDYADLHKTNSYWRSDVTYELNSFVNYRNSEGAMGTYISLGFNNNGNNPETSNQWKRVAYGTSSSYTLTAMTHPDVVDPFPNSGYFYRSDWPGQSGVWEGDTYGYAVQNMCPHAGSRLWLNKHGGLTAGPGESNSDYEAPPFRDNEDVWAASSEVPFLNMDYIDGVLPTPDGEPPKVVQAFKTYGNSMVLFNNGEVHYAGYNGHGQRGIGDDTGNGEGVFTRCGYGRINLSNSTAVLRGKKAIRIALAGDTDNDVSVCLFALIDNQDGTTSLYGWGYNNRGQLGLGNDNSEIRTPTEVPWDANTNGNIVDVWACGGSDGHSFILTDHGKMFAAGDNNIGQLGIGSTGDVETFTFVKDWSSLGGIKKFSMCGEQYMMGAVVTGNGQLWTWGENSRGNLGLGDTTDRTSPTRVSFFNDAQNVWVLGDDSNLIMYYTRGNSQIDNTLYAVGDNPDYNLGRGVTGDESIPNTVLDSFAQQIDNIVDARHIGGQNGNRQIIGLEQYVGPADPNTPWYKTRWYWQGESNDGGHGGQTASHNDRYRELPNAAMSGDSRYFFHSNFFYNPQMNPYRIGIFGSGRDKRETFTYWDRDTGRLWFSGNLYYGLSHSDEPVDRGDNDDNQYEAHTPQPLPYN